MLQKIFETDKEFLENEQIRDQIECEASSQVAKSTYGSLDMRKVNTSISVD